ncbi:MAG: FMN-binding protein [Bulleidia sp.]
MKKLNAMTAALLAAGLLAGCGSSASAGTSATAETLTTLTGEAEGYGGPITVELKVDQDNVIKEITITGNQETASVGGEAIPKLQEAIQAAGTIDGVDGVSGATYTSTGVFNAVKNALGIEEEATEAPVSSASASGLKQGVAVVSTPRLGPGADDKDVPVYSFNEVVAYVITDSEDRLVDLEVDILEIITPNHDSAEDNYIAGWPGQSYAIDADGDGTTEGEYEETEEDFMSMLADFHTKRDLGSSYKLNSGTWEQEMDIFEEYFKGKTAAEIEEAVSTLFSDVNGRPLNGNSDKEEDVAKRDALSDDQLAEIDLMSGATMSINDAHGDIAGAIVKAMGNAEAMQTETDIASIGLGIVVTPRLGPGADDKDVPVYSFNVVAAGTAFDADGKIADTTIDILEIITPNHDSADDNKFTGWPGQSYAADEDGDGTTEGELTQDEDTFAAQVNAFTTKRELGSKYKLNSGTWSSEMDIFEQYFTGKTADEVEEKVSELFSDVNGRPLNGNSDKEEDVAKRDALSEDQLAEIDTLSGATMSVSDAHGNIVAALKKSDSVKKASIITVD